MKTCSRCEESKPSDQFYRSSSSRDGLRPACKACTRQLFVQNNPPKGSVPTTVVCGRCGTEFTYERTTGQVRRYCGTVCRYEALEAAKKARSTAAPRRCACGSTEVHRVGKPVCAQCKTDKRDPSKAAARDRRRTLRRYGLCEQTWNELVAAQENRCAICRTDTPGGRGELWHIDHDHKTDQVRGLLCHMCNVGIGNLKDDPVLMRRAAEYIERANLKESVCDGREQLLAAG